MSEVSWIGLDWGTTNLRCWAINSDGEIIDHRQSRVGMNQISVGEFEAVLVDQISSWLTDGQTKSVVACGMVGAKQVWYETPYVQVPIDADRVDQVVEAPVVDDRFCLHIVPGLSQDNPPDVMRGEETLIAGYLSRDCEFSGSVCLPGTHTKWVKVWHKRIESFRSFMTGELFELLQRHSVLKHSLSNTSIEIGVFLDAATDALDSPDLCFERLFSIRASSLLQDECDTTSNSRLSGWLIGQELRSARTFWENNKVALVGSSTLATLYGKLLNSIGIDHVSFDATEAAISGLSLVAKNRLEMQ